MSRRKVIRGSPEDFKRRVKRTLRQLEQMIRDSTHWQKLHPEDASTIDLEDVRVARGKAKQCVQALHCGDLALAYERFGEMLEYMNDQGWGREPEPLRGNG